MVRISWSQGCFSRVYVLRKLWRLNASYNKLDCTFPSSGSGILPSAATFVRNSSIQGVLRNSITPEFMPAQHQQHHITPTLQKLAVLLASQTREQPPIPSWRYRPFYSAPGCWNSFPTHYKASPSHMLGCSAWAGICPAVRTEVVHSRDVVLLLPSELPHIVAFGSMGSTVLDYCNAGIVYACERGAYHCGRLPLAAQSHCPR